MAQKAEKIAILIQPFAGQLRDPHYLAYFHLFNQDLFYEAHDVLENLWLPQRTGPKGNFYKGLIQLAGAFVNLQKNRLQPAASLFKLAQANLEKYGDNCEGLNLTVIHRLINRYLDSLTSSNFTTNALSSLGPPKIPFDL